MNKINKLILLLSNIVLIANCQLSDGGIPESFQHPQLKAAVQINSTKLKKLNTRKLQRQDKNTPIPYRYAIYTNFDIDILSKGNSYRIDNGIIWQYNLIAENAIGISLVFSDYNLPEGAKLFIYSKNKSIILGAFTYKNNKEYKSLPISDIYANDIIIEYFVPNNTQTNGTLILGKVGQIYRMPESVANENGPLRIDVNCPEGDNIQLEKHAVAKMTYEKNGNGYLCTGALINNTKNDGTPYFLTANHCISNNTVANTLVTYFNYEKNDCNGTVSLGKSLSGATFKAGYDQFDFTLLLLDESPTDEYKPYFAGWNAQTDSIVLSGTGIHHPNGVDKKVSIDIDPIPSYPYGIEWDGFIKTPPHAHWFVDFDFGQTEGGSSGSPLFDENNRIIGQLSGGGEIDSYYGKLSRSWNDGNFSFRRLKPWLDPDDLGILVLDGYYPESNKPEAIPLVEYQDVCIEGSVELFDGSLFEPDTWQWDFNPSSVEYINGTDSSSQNPILQFNEATKYDIKLTVKKGITSHSRTKKQYIRSSSKLYPTIANIPEKVCLYDFNLLNFIALGASDFNWHINFPEGYLLVDSISLIKDTLLLTINPQALPDSGFTVDFTLIGSSANCSDTLYKSIDVINYRNDSIKYAYKLNLGKNGPYTNVCAGKELNEPSPPPGDCNSQLTWCECDTLTNLVDNSLWFTFSGPASGYVGINAPGFDNQIAIYEADSETDLLSGNPNNYKLIAANDDYFGEDKNYHALIDSAKVTPNKKYWVQVDGSACGVSGEFYLYLFDRVIDESVNLSSNAESNLQFKIFPNPTTGYFYLPAMERDKGFAELAIHTINGKLILSTKIDISFENQVKIPASTPEGLYILSLSTNDNLYTTKISILK